MLSVEELGETLANAMLCKLNFRLFMMEFIWCGIIVGSCGQLYIDIISKIQELCRRQWRVIIKKISREVNATAHSLVGKMKAFPYALIVFQESSEVIVDRLRLDSKFYSSKKEHF
ncbi:hypothetical protein PVK06_029767 [Gossypium arboreum]|uniref:RNase H type-1 domain-containing protein n=1 Tax=Gossypium arboreum TaxID=29729 RepID=A0ABR0NLG6_GOSAR|nr:hypothetical protein PVK06_029767 [Gossypium arboreum]